ncbi:MAG: hypothetical protein EZS28_030115 [Streblomastix strix]|uniref:Galectin n=1 Tax=Streblomastix strix TaxID=222440 RepID=A0A5J4UV74_9EUKA|nr:MAG: hypothetical protein EZS28_030115 [Streblomastix strix]
MHFGWFKHFGNWVKKNYKPFKNTDRVTLELNMDSNPRTLSFFVNDEEQKLYVVNVPPAVRFWVFLCGKFESFKIVKFESVSSPVATNGFLSRKCKWGNRWE